MREVKSSDRDLIGAVNWLPVVISNLAVSADAAIISTIGTTVVNFPTGFSSGGL